MPCTEIVMLGPCNALGIDGRVSELIADTVYSGVHVPPHGSHNILWPQRSLFTTSLGNPNPEYWIDWRDPSKVSGFALCGHNLEPGDQVQVDLYGSTVAVPVVGRTYAGFAFDLLDVSQLFNNLVEQRFSIQFQMLRGVVGGPQNRTLLHLWAFNGSSLNRELMVRWNLLTASLEVTIRWSDGTVDFLSAPGFPGGATPYSVSLFVTTNPFAQRVAVHRNGVLVASIPPGGIGAGAFLFPVTHGVMFDDRTVSGTNPWLNTAGDMRFWNSSAAAVGNQYTVDGVSGHLRPSNWNNGLEAYFRFRDTDGLVRNEVAGGIYARARGLFVSLTNQPTIMGQISAPPVSLETIIYTVPPKVAGSIAGCPPNVFPCCPFDLRSDIALFLFEHCATGARVEITKASAGDPRIGRMFFGAAQVIGDEFAGIEYGRSVSYESNVVTRETIANVPFRRSGARVRVQRFSLASLPDDLALREIWKRWMFSGPLGEVVFSPRPDIAGYEDVEVIHGQLTAVSDLQYISPGNWSAEFTIREWT